MAGEKTTANDLLGDSLFTQNQGAQENKLKSRGFKEQLKGMLADKSSPEEVIKYLKTLSPSGVELEFISLSAIDYRDKSLDVEKSMNIHIQNMLECFIGALKKQKDCDFVQACLNNFLKLHLELIQDDEILSNLLCEEL